MINFDYVTKESMKKHYPPYRMFIIGYSETGKTNSLLNFINHQPDFDQIYL